MQILAVNGLHNSAVRCLEWSTNGMKLFSADDNGLVVATELEYQHVCIAKIIISFLFIYVFFFF